MKGKASEARGIAPPADGHRRFPSTQKEILRCEAVVAFRTSDEMPHERAIRLLLEVLLNSRKELSVVVVPGIPFGIRLDPESGDPVLPLFKAYCRIPPHGEMVPFETVIRGGKMGPHEPSLRKCSHGKAFRGNAFQFDLRNDSVLPCGRIHSNRGAVRDIKKLAELRHRHEIALRDRRWAVSRKAGHPVVGVIIDSPFAIRVQHAGKILNTSICHTQYP